MAREIPMSAPLSGEPAGASDNEFTDHLEFVAAFSHNIAVSLDLEATLERALRGIAQFLKVEAGSLFLLEDGGKEMVCRACVGPADIRGLRVRTGEGIVGRSVARNVVEIVDDPRRDPSFATAVDDETGFVTRSILCAPLTVGDQRLGAIELLNKRDGGSFDARDVQLLRVMSSSAALAVSNARLAKALVEQERMRRELELAAEIQRSLLPSPDPSGFPVFGLNRPIRQVSGDFFDFFRMSETRIPFALGDVSGKGMNAAMLMAKTASLFRCLGKNVDDPAALLTVMNREIHETASRGMFVTMVAGIYDPTTGMLRFANAGHEPPLLRRPDRSYRTFPAESPPIGILPELSFETHEVCLDGGEFYIFTDGLTEFEYGKGERLGLEGLIQMVESLSDQPVTARVRSLLSELDRAGWEARDDLTVLTIDDAWVRRSDGHVAAVA